MSADALTEHPIIRAARATGPIYYAYSIVIPMQYAYVMGYNHLPDTARTLISAVLFGAHLLLGAITILGRTAAWNVVLLASIMCTASTWIPAHAMLLGEVHTVKVIELLRVIAFPLMLIWVLAYPLALPRLMLIGCAISVTVLACYVSMTTPPVLVSGTLRLGSLTGGTENMHTGAHFIALQLVLLDLLWRARLLDKRVAWAMMAAAAMVMFGYGGRNELVFVMVYFAAIAYFQLRRMKLLQWSPPVVIGLGIVAAVVILESVQSPGDLGSGRVGVWAYRLYLIAHRDPVRFLFGGGVGADYIWTPQWWWYGAMPAHNDYLHVMMEGGVVGLLGLGLLVYGVWLRTQAYGRAIVLGILANSMFANGFFQSPLLALSLSVVLATSILATLLQEAAASEAPREGGPRLLVPT